MQWLWWVQWLWICVFFAAGAGSKLVIRWCIASNGFGVGVLVFLAATSFVSGICQGLLKSNALDLISFQLRPI
jgi:hypothetical protein